MKIYLSARKQKKAKGYEKSNLNSITDDTYAPWNDLVAHSRVPRKAKTNSHQEFAKLPYSRGIDRGSRKHAKDATISDISSKKISSAALPTSPSLKERNLNIVTPTADKPDAIRNHAAPNHVPTPSTVSVTPLRLVARADSQADITPHWPVITPPVPSSPSPPPFPSIPSRRERKHIIKSSDEDTDEGGDENMEEFQTPPTKQRRYTHEKQSTSAHAEKRDELKRLSRDIASSSMPCMSKSRTAVAVTPKSPQADSPATWPSSKAAETTPLTSLYNTSSSPPGAVLSVFDFLSVVTPSTTKEKRAKKGSKKAKHGTRTARSDGKRTRDYRKWRKMLDFSNESDDDKSGDENEMSQGRQGYTNLPADGDAIQGRESKDTLARVECGEQSNANNICKRFPKRKNRGTICYLELESEDEELMQTHYDDVELGNARHEQDEPVPTRVGSSAKNESVANTHITLSIPKSRTSRTKPPSTMKLPHNTSYAGQNNHGPSTRTRSRPKPTNKGSDPEKPSLSFSDAPLTVTQTNSTSSSVLRHTNSPLLRVPSDSVTSLDPTVMSQDQHACVSLDIKSRPAFPKFTLSQIGKSFVLTGAKAARKKRAKDDAAEKGGELSRVAEVDKNGFQKDRRQAKRSWLQWQWEEPPSKFSRHRKRETMSGIHEAEHSERVGCGDEQANTLNEQRAQVDETIDDDWGNGSKEKGTTRAHEDEQIQEFDVRIDEPGGLVSKRDDKCIKSHVGSTHQQNNQSWCFGESPFHDGVKLPTPYDVEQSPPQLHRQSSAVSLCSLDVIECSIEEVNSREGNAEESAWRRDANGALSAEESSSQERTVEKASSLCCDADKIISEESDLEALRSSKGVNGAFSGEEGNVEERDAKEPSDGEIGRAARPLARRAFSPKIPSISSDPSTSLADSPPKETTTQSQSRFVSQTFDFPPPPSLRYPNRYPKLDTTGSPTISITLDKKKELSELTLTSLPIPLAPKIAVPKVAGPSSQAIRKRMLLLPVGKKVVPAGRVVTTARVTHGLGSHEKKPTKKRTMSNLVEQGFVTII
ncbi:hypothetical protein BC937DRAFT_93841 [Endogone sp. FLAS-F59071]|nr:hypothetical protein BC937DRAFT_93841 [Endogone sp. FLAS-F59071]|eukprot:RUS14433.1 hypothetical protein BC937DRAFT_93841 [Endogone sp. FLAS-F59071]